MKYVADVQGFKTTSNEFVFKEVAIIPVEEDAIPSVYLFEPPYPWEYLLERNQSENRWLQLNFHGLRWDSGNIPYEEVGRTFRSVVLDDERATVYVKGQRKVNWISGHLPDKVVLNIEDLGCPSLKKLLMDYSTCNNHETLHLDTMCDFRNAKALKKWLLEHEKTIIC